jgi:hypothetical protein
MPTAETIAIPFEATTLHGYLFRAADNGKSRPPVILNGGYDSSTAEESYFFSGAGAVARGYTAIAFDGTAQGAAINENGTEIITVAEDIQVSSEALMTALDAQVALLAWSCM